MAGVTFNLLSDSGLPLAVGPLDFGAPYNTVAEIAQCVRMILTTRIGEQMLQRAFGSDWSFIDKPMPQALAMIRASVLGAMQRWEPRAHITSIGINATIEGELQVNMVLTFVLPSLQARNTVVGLPQAAPAAVLDFNPDGSISVQTETIVE